MSNRRNITMQTGLNTHETSQRATYSQHIGTLVMKGRQARSQAALGALSWMRRQFFSLVG
ncbi:hypothetical protein PUV47_04900 [Pseudovibrio exalbescens]|uniref:hypothetical protein n=1 Tax=Pseudovibrio exalbescens TaxID=197461 RepID=UPI00236676DE|nr:hypothetical protein [Pseudovibrio exalbescens]MDD7909246.1 hypothetical protein [Pseudovibrio exalbescens]